MTKDSRKRSFALVSYLSEEQIGEVYAKHSRAINHIAYCVHDKDEAVPHIHILITTYNAHSSNAVLSWFSGYVDNEQKHINTFIQDLISPSGYLNYFTHSNTDKAQYSSSDIQTNHKDWLMNILENVGEEKSIFELMVDDYVDGVPYSVMLRRYGNSFGMRIRQVERIGDVIMLEKGLTPRSHRYC